MKECFFFLSGELVSSIGWASWRPKSHFAHHLFHIVWRHGKPGADGCVIREHEIMRGKGAGHTAGVIDFWVEMREKAERWRCTLQGWSIFGKNDERKDERWRYTLQHISIFGDEGEEGGAHYWCGSMQFKIILEVLLPCYKHWKDICDLLVEIIARI